MVKKSNDPYKITLKLGIVIIQNFDSTLSYNGKGGKNSGGD